MQLLLIEAKLFVVRNFENIEDFLENESFRASIRSGRLDPEWNIWLKENPDKEELYNRAARILEEIKNDSEGLAPQRKEILLTRIRQSMKNDKHLSMKMGASSRSHTRYRVAALGLVLFLSLTYVLFQIEWTNKQELVTYAIPIQWVTKSNPKGQKSRIILPDGSTITLNSDSEIKYRKDFSTNNREVHLTGEAFFEVAPDSLLEFKVHSGSLVTKALGTAFNIRYYDDLGQRIQLTSGRVFVLKESGLDEPIYLEPGQEVVLNKESRMEKKSFDIEKALLWKDNVIFFEDTPFPEVIRTLERWYGVKIEVKNKPKRDLLISTEFHSDYLVNVLNTLGYSFGFSYTVDKKNISIQFNQDDQ